MAGHFLGVAYIIILYTVAYELCRLAESNINT